MRMSKQEWETLVDWNLSNAEIARKYGKKQATVSTMRSKCAKETGYRGVQWKDIDWTMSDSEIAARYDRTILTVSIVRRKLFGVQKVTTRQKKWRRKPKEEARNQLYFRCSEELVNTVKQIVAEQNTTISRFVRAAVEEKINAIRS